MSGIDLFFYSNNGTVEKKEKTFELGDSIPSKTYTNIFRIDKEDDSVLFEKGRNVKISFDNVYYSLLFSAYWDVGSTMEQRYFYVDTPSNIKAVVKYVDGTDVQITEGISFKRVGTSKNLNISFEFEPQEDVTKIFFYLQNSAQSIIDVVPQTARGGYQVTMYSGEFSGDDKYQYSFEVSSEEAGLLKSIINWIKSIIDAITQLPEKIWEKISGAFQTIFDFLENIYAYIINIPSEIWSFIEEGLQKLFVPSESYIMEFKSDIDTLLAEKFGAVYQVVNITLESWDEVLASDETNIVSMPRVTIPLPDNNSFSFGGFDVTIVPSGFEFLATIVKSLVGIICTLLFINGLRNKYDEVMGVEK